MYIFCIQYFYLIWNFPAILWVIPLLTIFSPKDPPTWTRGVHNDLGI